MRRSALIGTAVVLAVGAVLVVAIVGPSTILRWDLGSRNNQLSAADRAAAISQIRSTLVQALGGVVLLVGAYGGWRQLQHNIDTARTQADLQRYGNVTDRYTRAIDQLASADQAVRVGAIHTLDRIAAEAEQERLGIVAILNSFIRIRAAAATTDLQPTGSGEEINVPLRSRSPEIQAALTVLTRWIDVDKQPAEWLTADLSYLDLRSANLHRSTLWHVRLYAANLAGANLSGADLRGADLADAILDDAVLTDAYADDSTWWPTGFNPVQRGVLIAPKPQTSIT